MTDVNGKWSLPRHRPGDMQHSRMAVKLSASARKADGNKPPVSRNSATRLWPTVLLFYASITIYIYKKKKTTAKCICKSQCWIKSFNRCFYKEMTLTVSLIMLPFSPQNHLKLVIIKVTSAALESGLSSSGSHSFSNRTMDKPSSPQLPLIFFKVGSLSLTINMHESYWALVSNGLDPSMFLCLKTSG